MLTKHSHEYRQGEKVVTLWIQTKVMEHMNMLAPFRSRCRMFRSCNDLRPRSIWMKSDHTTSSRSGPRFRAWWGEVGE